MALGTVGCGESDSGGTGTAGGGASASTATILIDGSSTVWPVSMAMAEAFDGAKVQVAAPSGTSGGFKKFMVGETDINDASRRIKDKEIATCKENGIEPIELTVAIDGISIVVNKENTWCDSLTFAQLKALWEPGSTIKTWKDLNAEWPDEPVALFGPDGDSGTFEYFTKVVVEKEKQCRDDYEPQTDDNMLVKGVSGDKYALGYFGYGYYLKARKDLKGLSIADKEGKLVAPTAKTIESYEYPLARPVFIYVDKNKLSAPGMAEFLKFYLGDGQRLVSQAGCVPLSKDVLAESMAALENAMDGK
jgi:phosphate transport system substrate-binding protein